MQIDGFASISAETIIVGATEQEPATGRRADVVKAAWHAAELAMRLVRVDNKNWTITENVNKIVSAWGCKAVEGISSFHVLVFLSNLGSCFIRHAIMPAFKKRY